MRSHDAPASLRSTGCGVRRSCRSMRVGPRAGRHRSYVWPGVGDDCVASTDTCSARRRSSYASVVALLRDVPETGGVGVYEQQPDPEATAMAVFPATVREAFGAHWGRLLRAGSLVMAGI